LGLCESRAPHDREQPIFGIQACGAEEFSTLEEMAAHYVEKVRAFQPTGPYHLGGYVSAETWRRKWRGKSKRLAKALRCWHCSMRAIQLRL